MKKNLLTMLAAILICGLTVTTMSACSSDDDKNDKADATVEKEIMYAVQISDNVLKVANVEVNYVDQTGAKKKDGSRIVEPANGKPYADRSKQFRYKINKGDLCYRLFIKHGFIWGGSWRTVKDYQHFEFHPNQ